MLQVWPGRMSSGSQMRSKKSALWSTAPTQIISGLKLVQSDRAGAKRPEETGPASRAVGQQGGIRRDRVRDSGDYKRCEGTAVAL